MLQKYRSQTTGNKIDPSPSTDVESIIGIFLSEQCYSKYSPGPTACELFVNLSAS